MALIDKVREACRVKTTDLDGELTDLINSAKLDLGIAGVIIPSPNDELVETAIKTYCKMHFGLPENQEWLEKSYKEQKQQLQTATGYTDWLTE